MKENKRLPKNVKVKVFAQEGLSTEKFMSVPEEKAVTIFLNGKELVALLATPVNLKELTVGFLWAEGFVDNIDEVEELIEEDNAVHVKTRKKKIINTSSRVYTSGFGRGVTFGKAALSPISSKIYFPAREITNLMKKFLSSTEIHRTSGGVHCSCLCGGGEILFLQEDIGRHNTIDKVLGEALLKGIATKDKMLFTTGRISSEMLIKALRASVPIVVSHSTPTNEAVRLGKKYGVTVVGYVRMGKMSVYSHPERITCKD